MIIFFLGIKMRVINDNTVTLITISIRIMVESIEPAGTILTILVKGLLINILGVYSVNTYVRILCFYLYIVWVVFTNQLF